LRSEKTWRIKLWYKTVATAQFHDTKMKRSETMKTLKEVACGSTVKVKKLTGEGPVKRRIMDMGITKGVDIYVRKVAPLGDPIEVTVRGYELSLRKADAEMIEVE
jgi:ferrous iron transport protein A